MDTTSLIHYTITERDGCRIAKGKIPLSAMATLLQGFPKGAVMDADLARMLGAVRAMAVANGVDPDDQVLARCRD